MKKYILTALLLTSFTAVFGQVTIGSSAPAHASATLDLVSINKGLLPPRMTTAQRNGISSPASGLTIYNTTEKCLNFYNGSGWASACGSPFYPVTQPVNKRLGGSSTDEGYRSMQTNDGGYIVAGNTQSSANGDVTGVSKGSSDGWIIKLNADGTIDWEKNYGGSGFDGFSNILQTKDGGYIVSGQLNSSVSGDFIGATKGEDDVWLLKLNASGNIVWQKNYGGNSRDAALKLIETADGGYIFAGYTNSSASGDMTGTNKGSSGSDWWIVKLDASGNITWQKNYGGSGTTEWALDIKQTGDGGYIVVGETNTSANGDVTGTSKGSNDVWVVKLTATGTITWQKNYGGSGQDFGSSVQLTADGGYIIGGYTSSPASGDVTMPKGSFDAWVIKLNVSGNIVWQKNYGGSNWDRINTILLTSDGGYIFSGDTESSANGDVTGVSKGGNDIWIVKLKADGTIDWEKNYGGSVNDYGRINQTADGKYIVVGYSDNNSAGTGNQAVLSPRGGRDVWIFTLDASGNMLAP